MKKKSHVPLLCLSSKVVEAEPKKAIVISSTGDSVGAELREQDISWKYFLSTVDPISR